MEAQELPSGVEIPEPAMNHPLTIAGFVVLILLVLAAAAKRYAAQTVVPAWRWVTGRDTRAYAEVVGELELVKEQLEASRLERRRADERHSEEIAAMREQHSEEIAAMREQHSHEIAAMRKQHDADMQIIISALGETRRQLATTIAGVNATRTAVENATN
ncbi:hypothetical protein [Rhodococcus sp. SGAir0479]|uniref:hypothetical protein n=1 Tax=Rhodococcus sp. SGAir0479 TaxID=2567884 RepID=UPI0010CCB1A1|nr:hypothetical protein [Rhodococcus sp. SGAir0479]QCQ91720.1 hypothetical protein E7742_11070 [Rhodococcus sp. SGAir0479]